MVMLWEGTEEKREITLYSIDQKEHHCRCYWQMFSRLHTLTHMHVQECTHMPPTPHTYACMHSWVHLVWTPNLCSTSALCPQLSWVAHLPDPGWLSPTALEAETLTLSEPMRAGGPSWQGIWRWEDWSLAQGVEDVQPSCDHSEGACLGVERNGTGWCHLSSDISTGVSRIIPAH